MPETKIKPQKIKSFTTLINSIDEEHPDLKIPKYALLIGAGCSLQCGIPLGRDIVELCKQHTFLKENVQNYKKHLDGRHTRKAEVEQKINDLGKFLEYEKFVKDKEAFLIQQLIVEKNFHLKRLKDYLKSELDKETSNEKLWEEYFDSIKADASYGFWMNQYSEDSETRQRLIEDIIDDRQPDGAYIILAYLIEKRKFTNILTTNFDDLINEAVMYYTEQRCRFYVDDELSQYISIHSKKPNIVKLHGDYRFANMKNTIEETDKLTGNIGMKLRELMRHLGLIIVGYNGADYSIMSVLQEFKEQYKYPLLWCGMDANNVHWRVARLINKTENSFFVEIKGFEWLMGQLAISFLSNVPDIEEKARTKSKIVDGFLEKFKVSFKESGGSPEEIERLDETMDKWSRLKKAEQEEDYVTVIELQSKIIDDGSSDPKDFIWRGWAYYRLDEFEKALSDFESAIDLDNVNSVAYNFKGLIYNEQGRYDIAIEALNKAIELNNKYDAAYYNRGLTYANYGLFERAIEDLNNAIELNPDSMSYRQRGEVYLNLKKFDNAMSDLTKAIELEPKYWLAYYTRADLYKAMGDMVKSKADRRKGTIIKGKRK